MRTRPASQGGRDRRSRILREKSTVNVRCQTGRRRWSMDRRPSGCRPWRRSQRRPPPRRRRRRRRAPGSGASPTPVFCRLRWRCCKWGKAALLLLPKAKVLTTSASMLVSVGAYALIWGWKFAVGFVALLFMHEMGHYIQLRREGVKPSGMVFIPFLGAAVGTRSLGGSALAEARVGPRRPDPRLARRRRRCCRSRPRPTTTSGARSPSPASSSTSSTCCPSCPLDGGRAMAAMAPWMWFVGFGAIVAARASSGRTRS